MTGPAPETVHARIVVERADGFRLDLDLDLPAGTTTALLGPNGAGKSTALQALAGLLPIDEGRIVFGDRVVDDPAADAFVPARERHVGVVFQDARLFDHLDVVDNVSFGPRSRGVPRRVARATATGWLERLAIAELAHRRPAGLSGGQAQRVALARALATEPALVLLDEPMSALDLPGRAALRRVLAEHLRDLSAPRLLVTHDPVEAFLLADRVAVVEDGRLTQLGTPAEIRQHPRSDYAAHLVGTNLLRARVADGIADVDGHRLRVADRTTTGRVLVTIPPQAVALSPGAPGGSPRNAWETRITRVEELGERVRVTLGAPLPITAEVTPGAVAELGLTVGTTTWASVKATEISLIPDIEDRP